MRVLLMCPVCGHFAHPKEEEVNDRDIPAGCDACRNRTVNRMRIDYDAEIFLNTRQDELDVIKGELHEKYLFNNPLFNKEVFDNRIRSNKDYLEKLEREQEEKNNPSCPNCGSTAISANKKGFGLGKAAVGGLVTGGAIGLLGGFIGSRKVEITCLSCGKKWQAGKGN